MLTGLSPEIHWFCPIDGVDAVDSHASVKEEDSEAWSPMAPSSAVAFEKRQAAFRACLPIYSFDGEFAIEWQKSFNPKIDSNLARCDACIVGYYKSKYRWIEDMKQ